MYLFFFLSFPFLFCGKNTWHEVLPLTFFSIQHLIVNYRLSCIADLCYSLPLYNCDIYTHWTVPHILLPHPLITTLLVSTLHLWLFLMLLLRGIIQPSFYDGIMSLSIMSSSPIPVVTIVAFPPFLRLCNIPQLTHFLYPFIYWWTLGYFHPSGFMSNAAMDMGVYISLWDSDFNSLDTYTQKWDC